MKRLLVPRALFLAAFGTVALTMSALADPHCQIRREYKLEVKLTATVDAPVGATGEIEFKLRQRDEAERSTCEITTSGLPAGSYSIDALNDDGTIVHVGDFGSQIDAEDDDDQGEDEGGNHGDWDTQDHNGGDGDNDGGDNDGEHSGRCGHHQREIRIALADGIDPLQIASLTVSDATGIVLLSGDATTASICFHSNVPVSAAPVPPSTTEPQTSRKHGPGKRAHGHALAHSIVRNGVEKKEHFLFVAFGAPASTELTVNIDGVPAGTVTSTKQGKVIFKSLPDSVVLAEMGLLTITDLAGTIVLQAQF